MRNMKKSLLALITAAALCFGVVAVIVCRVNGDSQGQPEPQWNDPALLADSQGALRWEKYAPAIEAEDSRHVFSPPPAVELDACMGWLQRALNTSVLPADLRSHLKALDAWPKRDGEDVFVAWYVVGPRLIHVVDSEAELVVFTVGTNPAQKAVPEEEHVAFAEQTATAVLASDMLPNKVSGTFKMISDTPGITVGTWPPGALELSKDEEGRVSMRVPTDHPYVAGVQFLTDGKFVRFCLYKHNRGQVPFRDRLRERFPIPAPPKVWRKR